MPTSTSLCISSQRFRPALSERNSYRDSLNDGRLASGGWPWVQGARCTCPGGADPPGQDSWDAQ